MTSLKPQTKTSAIVYTVLFECFLATQFLPDTGILSMAKEIGLAIFAVSSASFIGYVAIRCVCKPKSRVAIALCGSLIIAFLGATQTATIITDMIAGPQMIELTECYIASHDYAITGSDRKGNTYEFPLSRQEYHSLMRQVDPSSNTWDVRITGYTNCRRIITFTATKIGSEVKDE